MLLKRLYDANVAQASYLVGCQATGEALVIDPNRDVEQYQRAAKDESLRVTHVTETHIHADFVSGSRDACSRPRCWTWWRNASGCSSKHLRQLDAAGFVSRRREGLFSFYMLADRSVLQPCEIMCGRLEAEHRARAKVLTR